MRWGVVPLPRGKQGATMATLEGYAISATTSHPDAGWQWVRFLSNQMPYQAVPARTSVAKSPAYRDRVGPEVAEVVQAAMAQDAVLVFPRNQEVLMLFVQAAARALTGQASVQEAMRQAQQQSPFK
jgi:multiple sugar transport system substrate-binding protein